MNFEFSKELSGNKWFFANMIEDTRRFRLNTRVFSCNDVSAGT